MLLENSLYTNQAEKDELLKDRQKLADALIYNYFGFISLFSAIPRKDVKQWKNNELKVRLENITDDNTDVSLSVKLAYEAKMIPKSTVDKLTRLLSLFKQGKITKAKDINDDLVHDIFVLCKFDSVNKPSPRIMPVVRDYLDREINIAYLARDLYKFSRSDKIIKEVTIEFRNMFRNSGYVQVYSAFENGHTKLESGVPQKYIKTITNKTIIHQVKKVVNGSAVGITADNTSTGVDQVIDAVHTVLDKDPVKTPVVKFNDVATSTQKSDGKVDFSGITVDSRDNAKNLSDIGKTVTYNSIDLGLNKKIDSTLDAIANSTPSKADDDEHILGVDQTTNEPEVPVVDAVDNVPSAKEVKDKIENELQPEKAFDPYQDKTDFSIPTDVKFDVVTNNTGNSYSNLSDKNIKPLQTKKLYEELKSKSVDLAKYLLNADAFIQGYKDIFITKGVINGSVLDTLKTYYNLMKEHLKQNHADYPDFMLNMDEDDAVYFAKYYKKPNGMATYVYQALTFIHLTYAMEDEILFDNVISNIYDYDTKKTGFKTSDFKTFFTGGTKGTKVICELVKNHCAKINFNETLARLSEYNIGSTRLFDYYKFIFSIFDVILGAENDYKMPKTYAFFGDILYAFSIIKKKTDTLDIRPEVRQYFIDNRANLLTPDNIALEEKTSGLIMCIFEAETYRDYLNNLEDALHGYFDYYTDFSHYIDRAYFSMASQILETVVYNKKLSDDEIGDCVTDAFLSSSGNVFTDLFMKLSRKTDTYAGIAEMSTQDYYDGLSRIIKQVLLSIIHGKYNYKGDSRLNLLSIINDRNTNKDVLTQPVIDKIIENIYIYERLYHGGTFKSLSKAFLIKNGDIFKNNSSRLPQDVYDSFTKSYPLKNLLDGYSDYVHDFFNVIKNIELLNELHNNIYDLSLFKSHEKEVIDSYVADVNANPNASNIKYNLGKLKNDKIPFTFVKGLHDVLKDHEVVGEFFENIFYDKVILSPNDEDAVEHMKNNIDMVKDISEIKVHPSYNFITLYGNRVRIKNKETFAKFCELFIETKFKDKLPITLDFIENEYKPDNIIKLLKHCSKDYINKNVDISSFVDYSKNVDVKKIKERYVPILERDEDDDNSVEDLKLMTAFDLCVNVPSLFKGTNFADEIIKTDNNVYSQYSDNLVNDFTEYFETNKDNLANNIFNEYTLQEINELSDESKSMILLSKAKEEYEEIIYENIDAVSKVIANTKFDILTDDVDDEFLVKVAKINGIGIINLHKDLDIAHDTKESFLANLNQKIRNDFKADVDNFEAMPVDDIATPEDGSEFLIDESIKLYNTSNGNHGNVAPLVTKVYNVTMDRSKLDAFIEKDKLNPKSESKGKIKTFMFHGTGSIATAFITKFGFREIPEGIGLNTTGKMLGAGIYLAENVDKSLSYIGDGGFNKSYKEGYILEVDVCLGEYGLDFVDGRKNSALLSPEWCIRNFEDQIVVNKVYQLRSVNIDYYKAIVNKNRG